MMFAYDGVVLPRPVVIGVQAVHLVQFLAVVPVRLHVAVRRVVAELQAGGVVFHPLHDRPLGAAVCLDHLPHASEVVTVEVVGCEAVLNGVGGVFRGLAVSLVEQVPVNAAVPHRKGTAEQVVGGVGAQYLRRCQFPGRADGDGDVRHRREVRHAQFLSRRAVDVPRHAAVGELYADGVAAEVVVCPRYTAPGVAHEGTRIVVGEGIFLPAHTVEVRGVGVGKVEGTVAHTHKPVALVGHPEVIHQPEGAVQVIREPAAQQTGDVAVAVVVRKLVVVVHIVPEVVALADARHLAPRVVRHRLRRGGDDVVLVLHARHGMRLRAVVGRPLIVEHFVTKILIDCHDYASEEITIPYVQ